MIKQWLANWLLKGAKILKQVDLNTKYFPGHTIYGQGWHYTIPGKQKPEPAVKVPYVPKYPGRTEAEHRAIRKRIQRDPSNCQHLKGGRFIGDIDVYGRIYKDYNVLTHTFPNGKTRIRCANCSRVWWSTDPDWQDALKMVSASTNTPSSSETR